MNPFTGSIDRKTFLVWNIALSLIYYAVRVGFNSTSVLIVFSIISLLLAVLLTIRRMQNTGLNMWLLLAVFLPVADIVLLIALFFIPPKKSDPTFRKPAASLGFKLLIGLTVLAFIVLMFIMIGSKFSG
jgi:ABC-type uncharacterized transport system permease subunit